METMSTEERIAALEAEAYVLREYVRMLVRMLPITQEVGAEIQAATLMLNTSPRHDAFPAVERIQVVTKAMNLVGASRKGLLAAQ